ncbi:hypothetical protein LDK17_02655 [Fusobacterium polymorphum]
MNKKILVPDEYFIDYSSTKEEREKKGKEYEDACNKVEEQWDLENKKENK